MGRMGAESMREHAGDDMALRWHLSSNHYPPVHPVFLETARQAITLANQGEWGTTITMPNAITKSVADIIEGLHLEAFLDTDEF